MGVDGWEVQKVEKLLAEELESQELRRALASGDPQVMRTTFNRTAAQAGVDRKSVEEANKTITECEVFKLMEKAIADEDAMALQDAALQARRANLPWEDIEAAETLAQKLEARSRLKAALACKQLESVKWAIQRSEKTCEDPKLVQQAYQHLNRLEVLKGLEVAVKMKDCCAMRMYLAEAVATGTDGEEVGNAVALLRQLEAREMQRSRSPSRGTEQPEAGKRHTEKAPDACITSDPTASPSKKLNRRLLALPALRSRSKCNSSAVDCAQERAASPAKQATVPAPLAV